MEDVKKMKCIKILNFTFISEKCYSATKQLRSVKDWDQLNFTVFTISCEHSYSKMKSNKVMWQLSQALRPLMWLMTPILALPMKPQRTHLHFCESTSINMDQPGTVYAKVTGSPYILSEMKFCTTYMGVNDMQATHVAVKIIATLFSL